MTNYAPPPPLPLFDRPPPPRPVTGTWATRLAAMLSVKTRSARNRRRILRHLLEHGPATDHDLQAALSLASDTERPRRVELTAAGVLADTGLRRRTPSGQLAVAWCLSRDVRPASVLWLLNRLDQEDSPN